MTIQSESRRRLLQAAGGAAVVSSMQALTGCATPAQPGAGRVVVVGGGYGGATAAKYLRIWSNGAIDVTLVEPNEVFISCPISNLVLGGNRTMADITVPYTGLDKYGVKRVRDRAVAIDADKRQVRLASGQTLPYDRVVVSPGIDFIMDTTKGLTPATFDRIPHAWKAGPQTVLLRRQLEALPDGGTVVLSIPLAPYRCPPGPYERTCQIGYYLKTRKPKSKLLVLDANQQVTSKGPLFTRVWKEDYAGIVEYRPNMAVEELDVAGKRFITSFGETIKGDVLNFVPPQRAGDIARDAGLITANQRWCEVNWMTMESIKVPNAHVLGDSTLPAPAMPKSGHIANQHGKTAASAIIELLAGREPLPPTMANTCYSFIDDRNVIHVASVHRWVPEKKTIEPVAGAGGVSTQDRASWALEGAYAPSWAQTIWADMLA
jgi:sulfide dehydrogenase [flavocytochrome c] flavoprotein chain